MSSTRLRALPAALIAISLLTVPAAGQTRTSSGTGQAQAAVDLSKIRIDNFGAINGTYYRGAQPKGSDYADLASLGVKTLIDLTSDDAMGDEKEMASRAGLAYFQIPMTTHRSPTAAQLAQFMDIVNDPVKQPVYVHCVGGRHRTGVMTAVYRMTQDGWSADQAFKEMKHYKFGADFLHPEFKKFVYAFRPDSVHAIAAASADAR